VSSGIDTHALTLDGFVKHVFPDSAVRPLVENEILQIVVFSILCGIACTAMGERAALVLNGIEGISYIILRITSYVMLLAPLAVFCAIAATVSTNGLGILVNYAKFMGEFYLGLACLWLVLIIVGFLILGPSIRRLVLLAREPFLLAFATASSEAAYPKIAGAAGKVPDFPQHLQLYPAARLFVQSRWHDDEAYDIPLTVGTEIAMLLTLMVTSKGVAGVATRLPRRNCGHLSQFNLPEEGLLLILGIDTFLDIGRSATNVVGNSLATAVVAKWEGQLVSDVDTAAMIEEIEVERV
jgi:Na+/H+-dicarboxylate symporter